MKWLWILVIVLSLSGFVAVRDLYDQVGELNKLNARVQVLDTLSEDFGRRVLALEYMSGIYGTDFSPIVAERLNQNWGQRELQNDYLNGRIRSSQERLKDIEKSMQGLKSTHTLENRISALEDTTGLDRRGINLGPSLDGKVENLKQSVATLEDAHLEDRIRALEWKLR